MVNPRKKMRTMRCLRVFAFTTVIVRCCAAGTFFGARVPNQDRLEPGEAKSAERNHYPS